MPKPALATLTMLLNHTSQTDYHHLFLPQPDCRSSNRPLSFQTLWILFSISKIAIALCFLIVISFLCRPIQRRMLYGHKGLRVVLTRSSSAAALDYPESQGFLLNQVTSHFIPTSDGEILHSWLIMPIGAYTSSEGTLMDSWSEDEASEIALQILRDDPKAVLVVSFHSSGGHLATRPRCEAYRNLTTGSSDHLYVLAFDYRGFGISTGHPTEAGLIEDGLSVLTWVEKKMNIPRKRVLLMGHGIGAAVTVAAVEKVIERNRYAEYAGVVLCSSFTDMPKVMPHYKLGALIPILRPLTWSKRGRLWLDKKILADTWRTTQRLKNLVKSTDVLRLSIMHAIDDNKIPHTMSDVLFSDCVDELAQLGTVNRTEIELGMLGNLREVTLDNKLIREVTMNDGGHSMFLSTHAVSFEALRMFRMTGAIS